MVVRDLDVARPFITPHKTNAKLVIDPDAVLAASVTMQSLKLIARWNAQRIKRNHGIQLIEFAAGDRPDLFWTRATSFMRVHTIEDVLCAARQKGTDHRVPSNRLMSQREIL
jgi:hypothetical protein